jgi:methionine salvage enolase-phosphatase E1
MSSGFRLITGSPAVTTMHMRRLLVRLAVRGPIRWLVCGNYLDLQRLIYEVVQRAKESYYYVLENNIAIARAETCYQVVALLRKTEAAETPTFVSDLLLHFYDEGVHDDEAAELFIEGVQALKQLSQGGPVIVSASGSTERSQLYTMLLQNADRITQFSGDTHYGS